MNPTCKNGPCHACVAITKIDEEIKQAGATLRRLLVKRCDLRSEQNRAHGSLVHRLPVELKNYIFELLLPSRDEWGRINHPGVQGRVTMPFHLASICRSWRDIAWSNPLLWSTIVVGLGTQISTPDRINFVHEWILRSRTMPLTLHLAVRETVDQEELKGVIEAINQCSNRWHSLFVDMSPKMLSAFQHNNFQCHLLKRLRINGRCNIDRPVPFLNPELSPEHVEIRGIPFRSLQISWNHLFSATVERFDLEEIMQLFQHALQMNCCFIIIPRPTPNFSMPPITHQSLKTLKLGYGAAYEHVGAMLLGSLTLPCLQEFIACEFVLLLSLPALVQRSSCPLTRISLLQILESDLRIIDDLQPLHGVTELDLDYVEGIRRKRIELGNFLEEYFPDLSRLTLGLSGFYHLWELGIISMLLDRKRPQNEGRRRKILVADRRGADVLSELGIEEQLESLQLNISVREGGFELSIPEA